MKWKMPKPVADWAFRRNMDTMRSLRWRYLTWWVLLGGVAMYLIYRLEPSRVPGFALVIVVAALVLPALLYLQLYMLFRTQGIFYALTDKGSLKRSDKTIVYGWKTIEGFWFYDFPDVPGIRCLAFEVRRLGKRRREWYFDPSEVDESVLRSILEEHLPGKCLDNMPEGSD